MSRHFGRTREDIAASSIAKALVEALTRLEEFTGDPEMVLDDMTLHSRSAAQGVKDAIIALRQYYLTPTFVEPKAESGFRVNASGIDFDSPNEGRIK